MASRPNPAQLFARVQADDLDGALQAGLMDYVARAGDEQLLPGHPDLPQRLQQAQQQLRRPGPHANATAPARCAWPAAKPSAMRVAPRPRRRT
jgi:hypothetical protein